MAVAAGRDTELCAAIHAAVSWVLARRDARGWWSDFSLAPGASDEWVTAYVGSVLTDVGSEPGRCAAASAWELLRTRQREDGGWGYNGLTPSDADSTLWALRLAERIGADGSEAAQRGHRRLVDHLRPDGGMATYAADGPIRAFTGSGAQRSFAGWCASHVCVTAAAARAPRYRRLVEYLRDTQRPNGRWRAYWWGEDAYATALAADALICSVSAGDRERVRAAAAWATRCLDAARAQPANGSLTTFARAWCVYLLSRAPERLIGTDALQARADASKSLIDQQRPDGSWEPAARMRLPHPEMLDPDECKHWIEGGRIEGAVVVDQNAIFTTATVMTALCAWRARLGEIEGTR